MHEQITLVRRGQRVYIVTDWLTSSDRPECLRDYWRVAISPEMLPEGWQEGTVTRNNFAGSYTLRVPRAGWAAFATLPLINGAQSRIDFREEIPLERPKVKAGVSVEWDRYGYTWRKYLKTKGWVNINSFPAPPVREGERLDVEGFSICSECSRINGRHHAECKAA